MSDPLYDVSAMTDSRLRELESPRLDHSWYPIRREMLTEIYRLRHVEKRLSESLVDTRKSLRSLSLTEEEDSFLIAVEAGDFEDTECVILDLLKIARRMPVGDR